MATIPSIAMIPSGYKASKVYSVLPTDGAGDLTFSRAGALPSFNATRVNSDGLIEEVLSNVPRLDYSDGGCPSLLIEPQSTNLLLRSEQFDDAAWAKTRTTVSANSLVSPDGNSNADTLVANVGTATSYFLDFTTLTGTGIFTASIFAKKGNSNWLYIRQGSGGGGTALARAWFDLNNGTIGSTSPAPISHSIEDYGNGWYRCSMTFEVLIGGIPRPQFYISNGDGVATFDSDGTQSINLWGAQLEALPYATSYIPTVASTVTRVAETVSKTGISDLIGQSEGVWYWEGIINDTGAEFQILNSTRNISNAISITRWTNNRVRARIWSNSVLNVSIASANNVFVNTKSKIALSYKSGNVKLFYNGVLVASSTESFAFTVPISELEISVMLSFFGASLNTNNTDKVLIFKTQLSDVELIALTTL
jgi:hypothetical protein